MEAAQWRERQQDHISSLKRQGTHSPFSNTTTRSRTFTVARAIVRMLKLKSAKEWEAWCKSRQRPFNIPSYPARTYRDDGWISMPDWLGYHPRRRQTCKWSQRFCDSDEKEHAALQSLNTPDRLRRIATRVTAEVAGQRAEREERHHRRRRRGGGPSTDGGDDSSNSSGSDEVKICPSPP